MGPLADAAVKEALRESKRSNSAFTSRPAQLELVYSSRGGRGRRSGVADLLRTSRGSRRPSRVAPLAADVGQRRGNLVVAEGTAERRHQPGRAFLAVEQDAGRDVGRAERELEPTRLGASFSRPRPSAWWHAVQSVW